MPDKNNLDLVQLPVWMRLEVIMQCFDLALMGPNCSYAIFNITCMKMEWVLSYAFRMSIIKADKLSKRAKIAYVVSCKLQTINFANGILNWIIIKDQGRRNRGGEIFACLDFGISLNLNPIPTRGANTYPPPAFQTFPPALKLICVSNALKVRLYF